MAPHRPGSATASSVFCRWMERMIRNWEIDHAFDRDDHGAHEHGEHQSAATPLQASQCVAGHRGEDHVAEDGDQADHQRVEHVVEYRDLLEHGNVVVQRRGLRHQVGRHGVDVVALALERQGQFPDERTDEQQEHQNQNQILDDFADGDLMRVGIHQSSPRFCTICCTMSMTPTMTSTTMEMALA